MKRTVLLVLFVAGVLASRSARGDEGWIGVYGDPAGSSCQIMDAPYAVSTAYVLHMGPTSAQGSRFRVVTDDVSTMTFLAASPNPALVHYGDASTGIDIGYAGCETDFPQLLVTVTYLGFGTTPGCETVSVAAHPQSTSGLPEVYSCQNEYLPAASTEARVSVDGSCECAGFSYRDVTVETEPAGLVVTVDNDVYTSPVSFQWLESSLHTVSVPAQQAGFNFLSWSDGGARSHTVQPGEGTEFVTATYLHSVVPPEASGPIIGIYADENAGSCQLVDPPYQTVTAYVLHVSDTPANTSQFRIRTSPGFTMIPGSQTVNPSFLSLGTPAGGITITYTGCKTTFPLKLITLQYIGLGTSPPCSYIDVVPDPAAGSGQIEVVDCNFLIHPVPGGRLVINGDGSCPCGLADGSRVSAFVSTTPTGLGIVVDGAPYTAPTQFAWSSGSQHSVAVDSVQTGGGTVAVFSHWSDGGARSHTVTMPPGDVGFRATFDLYSADPAITGVTDVPADQGGAVHIAWDAIYDDDPGRPDPIASYVVYRGNGTPFVAETVFDSVLSVSATGASSYEVTTSTRFDSTGWLGVWYSRFYVQARSQSGLATFTSQVDSGYSVDNVVPAPPTNFAVDYNTPAGNVLTWTPPGDADYVSTAVYRSLDPDFVPSPANRIVFANPPWTDNVPDGYRYSYKLRAVDKSANESAPATPGLVTAVEGRDIPRVVVLKQNSPNPFNPVTRIEFSLPREDAAVLRIFDVGGRLVRRLYDGPARRGFTSVEWDGTNDTGDQVGSGVYFYQLHAGGARITRKMVLLK